MENNIQNKKIAESQINEMEEKVTNLNISIQNSKVRIDMMGKQKNDYQDELKSLGVSPDKVKQEISDMNEEMKNIYNSIIEALPFKLLLAFKYVTSEQIETLKKGLTDSNFKLAESLYDKTIELKQSALSKKDIYKKQDEEIDEKLKKIGISQEKAETRLSEINTQMSDIYEKVNVLVPNLKNPENEDLSDF